MSNDMFIEKAKAPFSNETDVTPYIFNVDKIVKAGCKICQAEFRDEVELMFDEQKDRKNYTAIRRIIKDKYNFDISVQALMNHMIRHYKQVNDNTNLREYAEDIQHWVGMQTNKISSLKARIAVLEKEYFTIASQSDGLNLVERRKNSDTLKKLAEVMLAYENKIEAYQEFASPVSLIFNQLKIIVNDELQSVDNVKTKQVFSKVLSRLKTSCGDMIIE